MKAGVWRVALVLFPACGCLESGSAKRSPESAKKILRRNAGTHLERGIKAYNDGRIERARSWLEMVLGETKDSPLAYTRAAAHFYLAAIAWDLGEKDRTEVHLRRCRYTDPTYEPDWTFISPRLRKRFESLK